MPGSYGSWSAYESNADGSITRIGNLSTRITEASYGGIDCEPTKKETIISTILDGCNPSSWSICNPDTKRRTRTFSGIDAKCPPPSTIQSQPCTGKDCTYKSMNSTCDKITGFITRDYISNNDQTGDGVCLPKASETISCKVDCEGVYGEWKFTFNDDGSANRTQTLLSITHELRNGGSTCEQSKTETISAELINACSVSEWSICKDIGSTSTRKFNTSTNEKCPASGVVQSRKCTVDVTVVNCIGSWVDSNAKGCGFYCGKDNSLWCKKQIFNITTFPSNGGRKCNETLSRDEFQTCPVRNAFFPVDFS